MARFKLTLVVACALVDTDGRVLIAQRPPYIKRSIRGGISGMSAGGIG